MTIATADLSDAHPQARVADPIFRDFGGVPIFYGRVTTAKLFEDNAIVRTSLEEPGHGRVLVIDGGGSMRCALLGGNLAQLAVKNGWAGAVINGCIRDSEEIRRMPLGVKALGTHPRKSEKGLHLGHRDRTVVFAGVSFRPDQWLYADADGIVLSAAALHE
jgi:regulator of ribonuclease activity A